MNPTVLGVIKLKHNSNFLQVGSHDDIILKKIKAEIWELY